ncbi:MAG: hypothetical protein U1F27_09250 [Turneriella sp.]
MRSSACPPRAMHVATSGTPVFDRLTALIPDIVMGETTEGRIGRAFMSGNKSIEQAYMNPSAGPKSVDVFNEPWVRHIELPWVNGVANARSLAAIMNVLASGGRYGKVQFANADLMRELTKENPLRYDLDYELTRLESRLPERRALAVFAEHRSFWTLRYGRACRAR